MAKESSARSKAAQSEPAAEIAMLQNLSQSAIAWLLNVNGRSIRDGNAPRNPDGSYNAQDVVAWRLDRPRKAIALSDAQYEAVLHIVDRLGEHIGGVRDGIDRLAKEIGPGDEVLGLIFRSLLDDWDASCRLYPQLYEWGGQDIGHKYIVCRDCKRVRRGRRWKVMAVPRNAQDVREGDYCDDCNRKHGEQHPGRHDWPLYGDDESDDVMSTATN